MSTIKVDETAEIRKNTASFLYRNQKPLTFALIALAVLIAGFFAYKYFVQAPNEEKAEKAIYTAEQYMRVDSFNLALNGADGKEGFLQVISKYGGTKTGNRARILAAKCLLELNQPQDAIKHLEAFSGSEMSDVAAGLLGDAYVEIKDMDKALNSYKKAYGKGNALIAAKYLRHASNILYSQQKYAEAIELEKKILKEYPASTQGSDAEKWIALYGQTNID